jgi:hypothetical protein
MKIKCPWKGCSGDINITKDLSMVFYKNIVYQIPWLIHTIKCPKCGNIVGNFDIYPQPWVSLRKDGKIKDYSVSNPRTGVSITFKKNPDLGRFLKKWARTKRD